MSKENNQIKEPEEATTAPITTIGIMIDITPIDVKTKPIESGEYSIVINLSKDEQIIIKESGFRKYCTSKTCDNYKLDTLNSMSLILCLICNHFTLEKVDIAKYLQLNKEMDEELKNE